MNKDNWFPVLFGMILITFIGTVYYKIAFLDVIQP